MHPREAIPPFCHLISQHGNIGIGLDLATSDGTTSNPASLCVLQETAPGYTSRLLIAWKTRDERVTTAVVDWVVDSLMGYGHWPRRLCADASNEVFFANALRRHLAGRVPVVPIKGGENIEWRGEKLPAKELLGNLYSNAVADGKIRLPAGQWIYEDQRLVRREAGRFVTATGKSGQHGDTFDACKLALWSLIGGGPVRAEGVQVGGNNPPSRPGLTPRGLWKTHRTQRTTNA